MWPLLFGLVLLRESRMMSPRPRIIDMSRFGMELMRPSPRQSDLMIVAGAGDPQRWPRCCAACTTRCLNPNGHFDGRLCIVRRRFSITTAVMQGVDGWYLVDVYVAGCPPRPEALIHGVLTLYEKSARHQVRR